MRYAPVLEPEYPLVLRARGESVTVNGLTFTRNESRVFVTYDGTRLQLLAKESYE